MMDLINQLAFIKDLPPLVQDMILNLILLIVAVLMVLLLRRLGTVFLVPPLRALASRASADVGDMLVDAVLSPLRIAVMGLALIITVNLLGFGSELQQIAETLARALIIGAAFYAAVKVFDMVSLRPALFKQVTGMTMPERLMPFLNTVVKSLIAALGAVFVLQELNFDVTALIASLGVVGIGVSLASQNTVANLFGFAAIVTDNPFKVGDFIKTPNVTGIVEAVGARSTRVRQLDQALVTVPNNLLTNAIVLNWSRLQKRRLSFTLALTYSTTSAQMRALVHDIRALLQNTDDIDPDSIIVHFVDFSPSSLDVLVRCQVLLADWRQFTALKEKLYLRIMDRIEQLDLSFAFPSQSIYIENPAAAAPEPQPSDEHPQKDSKAGRDDGEIE